MQQPAFWTIMEAASRFDSALVRAQILRMRLMSVTRAQRLELVASFRLAMEELNTAAIARAAGFTEDSESFQLARAYAVTSGVSMWRRAATQPDLLATYNLSNVTNILSVLEDASQVEAATEEDGRTRRVTCGTEVYPHRNGSAVRNLFFQLIPRIQANREFANWLGSALPESVTLIETSIEIRQRETGAPGRLRRKVKKDSAEIVWTVSDQLMECDHSRERDTVFLDEVRDLFDSLRTKFKLVRPEFIKDFRLNPEFTVVDDPTRPSFPF